jgi:hypothetical protein
MIYNQTDARVQRSPSRWEFRASGMKFDIVTQWMIAYAVRHIPLCRACSDVGEDGVYEELNFARLALALRDETYNTAKVPLG